MVNKIDKAMQAMVKDLKFYELEVLLCVEKTVDGDHVLTEWLMPAALLRQGNAGIWTPTMAGITFEAGSSGAGQRPYTGTLLCMARESHTPATFTSYASFTDGGDVGPFCCCSLLCFQKHQKACESFQETCCFMSLCFVFQEYLKTLYRVRMIIGVLELGAFLIRARRARAARE